MIDTFLEDPTTNFLPKTIIIDNIQRFVQYFLLVLNQVSNKNTQQGFYVSLLADWKGLIKSGMHLLHKASGVGLDSQTYALKKKKIADEVYKMTVDTCQTVVTVGWFDNFNISWRNKSAKHSTQPTNVTNWTVFSAQFLPTSKNTLKLETYEDDQLLPALPHTLPSDTNHLLTSFANQYKQVSYSSCFIIENKVYNFPYDLSLKYTPDVDKKKIKIYKEAGKLTNYLSLDLQPFNSASNTGLQKDLLCVREYIQNTSPEHYQPYIFDQNIYPRVVKVLFFTYYFKYLIKVALATFIFSF